MKPRILMVGAGGYGQSYLKVLFGKLEAGEIAFAGIISTSGAKNNRFLPEIEKHKIPVFPSLEEFNSKVKADIAVISSPIQLHLTHARAAIEAGMNVLCEKPVSAVIQEARQMKKIEDESGKFVSVGYDWSFTPSVQKLKQDIISGVFGKPLRLKTITLWPRTHLYYARSRWAGRIKDDGGNWVLDSPVNNATAHYLHNMLYVLGKRTDSSAVPASVESELYRANNIENYDSGALRILTEEGAEILFLSTHAVPDHRGPDFEFEFEKGKAFFDNKASVIKAVFKDGEEKTYGNPNEERTSMPKVNNALAVLRGDEDVLCGIEAASSQTICVNGAQEASVITPFPAGAVKVKEDDGKTTYAEGLCQAFSECYEKNMLPSEAGIPWAVKAGKADLRGYRCFPSGGG